jgi:hypothetical protein
MILPLFAFYVIKNSINRDRETRVGQIIATTPVNRPLYLLGKWLSNLAVLTMLLVVLSLMALLMQLIRAEALAIQPTQLLVPLWLLGLPVMALVAAIALLFESLPLLSGGVGNIVYFFAWFFYLGQVALPGLFRAQIGWLIPHADVLGVTRPIVSLQSFAATIDSSYNGHFNIAGANYGRIPSIVTWEGMPWTMSIAAERLTWLAAAVGLVLLTTLVFDRFDPARTLVLPTLRKKRMQTAVPQPELAPAIEPPISLTQLSDLAATPIRPSLLTLLRAELRLLLFGRPRWFYVAAGFITLLSIVAPPGDGPPIAALAWVWPLLLWSELGTRNRTFHTQTLMYAAPEPRRAQFWMPWLAGVLLALVATAVLSVKALAAGDILQWLGILTGTLFVPSLALACGVGSGNGRLFQVVYLLWWFSAAVGNTWLDFMGYSADTAVTGVPIIYLATAVGLLGLGWLMERNTIRYGVIAKS